MWASTTKSGMRRLRDPREVFSDVEEAVGTSKKEEVTFAALFSTRSGTAGVCGIGEEHALSIDAMQRAS